MCFPEFDEHSLVADKKESLGQGVIPIVPSVA